jgi:hypothetical protein
MPERRCKECKVYKDTSLFFKNYLCNRCKIIADIGMYLTIAKLAYHFNTNIKEIDNILEIDMNDPSRNLIGEHRRYDDVMGAMVSICNSQFNNTETISNYLKEYEDTLNPRINTNQDE